jgi:type IV pilus assembly protein PilA
MSRLLNELRRRRRDQKGFTLIEMLVVISILGILAAVVTMSMVGVVNLAQQRADAAELNTIQVAVDTMANEQQVAADKVCPVTRSSNDMSHFPVDPADPTNLNVLPTAGTSAPLYPRYLRTLNTKRNYTCDVNGKVSAG